MIITDQIRNKYKQINSLQNRINIITSYSSLGKLLRNFAVGVLFNKFKLKPPNKAYTTMLANTKKASNSKLELEAF
jgi:hypothetical protein